jgi:hypothetical protein
MYFDKSRIFATTGKGIDLSFGYSVTDAEAADLRLYRMNTADSTVELVSQSVWSGNSLQNWDNGTLSVNSSPIPEDSFTSWPRITALWLFRRKTSSAICLSLATVYGFGSP